MDELIEISKLLAMQQIPDQEIAKELARWALPGEEFDETRSQFKSSGLTLGPFADLVGFIKDGSSHDRAQSGGGYEFCA